MKLTLRPALVLVLGLYLTVPNQSNAARTRNLSALDVRALIHNGRSIRREMLYSGKVKVDTGRAIEQCLSFRDNAGNRWYVRQAGLLTRVFLRNRSYGLRIRLIARARDGIPLAEASQGERLVAAARKPYEGDIRERDPRAREIRAQIIAGKPAPLAIRLRYSGTWRDYAVFYDLAGREILFRYREDRFDRRAEKKIRNLVKGEAYLVKGQFTGVLLRGKFVAQKGRDFAKALRAPDATLVYDYGSAATLRLEQIIL